MLLQKMKAPEGYAKTQAFTDADSLSENVKYYL